jgi:hypothetical protein
MQQQRPFGHGGLLARAADSPQAGPAVFTLFVIAGSAYIVVAKLGGIEQIYVTFVPVAIMLGYALLIYLARNFRLRDDQAGDNLYYMGFLFTLTSLGVSLYQFNATHAAEDIVQNFGIAIGSTITGIALRVIFNQMRRDPIEVERVMRLELAEAARRVRRELDSTVVEFSYLRRSAQQAATDSFNLVGDKFEAISARLMASMGDVMLKSTAPLEAASRRSSDAIDEMTNTIVGTLQDRARTLTADTERLSKSAAEISTALDGLGAKLATMRLPRGVIELDLEPVMHSLRRSVDRFTSQAHDQAGWVKEALEAAKFAAETSSASIVALREKIDVNSATNRAALEAATRIISAMTQLVDEFKSDTKDQVQLLRQLLEGINAVRIATETDDFRDERTAMQPSAQRVGLASESVADIAEGLRALRATPKRGMFE